MKSIALYSRDQVIDLLDYSGCIEAMRTAMVEFSQEDRVQPLRQILPIVPEENKLFALMPGIASQVVGFGAKILSVFEDPDNPGRAPHQGVVTLFNSVTGAVEAIADAHEVTKIRTACVSAMATDILARPDTKILAIFGTGAQAESHIKALSLVRSFEKILVWGRSKEKAQEFVSQVCEETGLPIFFEENPVNAAGQADVICTVTNSATPVLLRKWVKLGTHINAVGSSYDGPVEVDSDLVVQSRYFVDSRRSALAAAAEFLSAKKAGLIDDSHIAAEIGDVILGGSLGRENTDQITFYKSLGHIVQDLSAVAYLHTRASNSMGGV